MDEEFLTKASRVTGIGCRDRSSAGCAAAPRRRAHGGNRVMHGCCPGCVFTPT